MRVRTALAFSLFVLCTGWQLSAGVVSVGGGLSAAIPAADSASLFRPGPGATLGFDWAVTPSWSLDAEVLAVQTDTLGAARVVWGFGTGALVFVVPLAPGWTLRSEVDGGGFGATLGNGQAVGGGVTLGAGVGVGWVIGPTVEARLSLRYFHAWDLYDGFVLGASWWVGGDE